ncbi:uncharacterized protein RSE6_14054 [Rhynchosporium secalis]|uniref:Uncharacterized protein n=1 Tax=Rhynchosporium secalis TaxID=38038 RepID=A0A1E1MV46_RHYSE|nr:uncharacterized protein RSE6_14054 [Rhynchosporium secalis]
MTNAKILCGCLSNLGQISDYDSRVDRHLGTEAKCELLIFKSETGFMNVSKAYNSLKNTTRNVCVGITGIAIVSGSLNSYIQACVYFESNKYGDERQILDNSCIHTRANPNEPYPDPNSDFRHRNDSDQAAVDHI